MCSKKENEAERDGNGKSRKCLAKDHQQQESEGETLKAFNWIQLIILNWRNNFWCVMGNILEFTIRIAMKQAIVVFQSPYEDAFPTRTL